MVCLVVEQSTTDLSLECILTHTMAVCGKGLQLFIASLPYLLCVGLIPQMTNPAIQNDFSYYRRTLNRMRINNVPVSRPTHTHTHTHSHTHTHAHAHSTTHTHAHTHTHTHTYTKTAIHTHSLTRTHTHTHTHSLTRTHAHTNV